LYRLAIADTFLNKDWMRTLLVLAAAALVLIRHPRCLAWTSAEDIAVVDDPMDILGSRQYPIPLASLIINTHVCSAIISVDATERDMFSLVANVLTHAGVSYTGFEPARNHALVFAALVDVGRDFAFFVHPEPVSSTTVLSSASF
jgi:hypothetical protein